MRLKRLELQGFKSFLDRTILTFEPGITGVVGPNGCGKSNIVDAIQWVMGEQSAKHLRGDSMTDVIFNGSDTRAPTSMAEVTLVLDRRGVALAPAFAAFDRGDEIAISRRVYRDGTGEYFINKTPCRLKDIHELFMDTGVGRRAYSIIEQGQVDRMVNAKPDDRRFIFEEVAGITKYKSKRKEAEKKLELTRQNLLRIQDIIAELEKQIRSLKVQATRARRYKEIKVELESVDGYLLGRQFFDSSQAVQKSQTLRDTQIDLRSQSDARLGEQDSEITQLEIQRIDQEKEQTALSERERDLSLQIQRLENQVTLFRQRQTYIEESRNAIQDEEEEKRRTLESLESTETEHSTLLTSMDSELQTLVQKISTLETMLRELTEQRVQNQRRRDQLFHERNQLVERGHFLQSQHQLNAEKQKEAQTTRSSLNQKLTDAVVAIETVKERLVESEQKVEDCSRRIQVANEEATHVDRECKETSRRLMELEESLFGVRETFHQRKSKLQSLQELQQNLEGYSPTAREILLRLEGDHPTAVPLAELLQPEVNIEDHLEMLLTEDLNTLVVNTATEAERLTSLIRERNLERVRILATQEADLPRSLGAPPAGIPLLSKIRIREGFEAVARWALGSMYLCENDAELFRLRAAYPNFTFITLDSRTVGHEDRSLTTGNMPTKMGVFARRREIEELGALCAHTQNELELLSTERENLLQHLKNQEQLHSDLRDKLSALHIESVERRKEKETFQVELGRHEGDYQHLLQDSDRNHALLDQLAAQWEETQKEQTALAAQTTECAETLQEKERLIQEGSSRFEQLTAEVNEAKIELSRLEEKQRGQVFRIEKLRSEIDGITNRLETIFAQRKREEQELSEIESSCHSVTEEKEEATTAKNEVLIQISDVRNAYHETYTRLQDLRNERADLQKRREALADGIQQLEVSIAQDLANLEHMKGISIERYQQEIIPLDANTKLSLEKAPLLAAQLEQDWDSFSETDQNILLEEHLRSLREKVTRYGEVNLTSIQEFDEIQKRYDFLITQRGDLEKAIQILEEAIQKIDESTQTKFKETFDAVNKKFREIFPILFNGGEAELSLVGSENVLEAGVDIIVYPPGKRPASITLLSGGEKALTAVSLILAIFARKPSPFCLLDEVDAPLDDANVSRFNTVVRKMAEKTQFIVITHNKKTMEVAEALYGVTMERAGISKMSSVRLS